MYKITIEDTVEERILELQEKKRELANQAIEGGKNQNAGKLGMKEIMQLFRRDAEHAPPQRGDATSYTMPARGGILNSPSREASASARGSSGGSREGSAAPSIVSIASTDRDENSVLYVGERKIGADGRERTVVPTKIKPKPRPENPVFGRRW